MSLCDLPWSIRPLGYNRLWTARAPEFPDPCISGTLCTRSGRTHPIPEPPRLRGAGGSGSEVLAEFGFRITPRLRHARGRAKEGPRLPRGSSPRGFTSLPGQARRRTFPPWRSPSTTSHAAKTCSRVPGAEVTPLLVLESRHLRAARHHGNDASVARSTKAHADKVPPGLDHEPLPPLRCVLDLSSESSDHYRPGQTGAMEPERLAELLAERFDAIVPKGFHVGRPRHALVLVEQPTGPE